MKRISLILLSSLSLVFTSCLKDEGFENREFGMDGIEDVDLIEFPSAPDVKFSLDYSTADTTFTLVKVRLNSEAPAAEDITVTLVPDASLIEQYNDENETNYTEAPSSIYTLDNLTVTIPKGSREGTLKITTKPSELSQGEYALGFKIGSVSNNSVVVSRNYQNIVAIVGVKNQYDGIYNVSVELTGHPSASGHYDDEVHFATVSPNAIDTYLAVAYIFAASSRLEVTVNADNTLSLSSNAAVIVPLGDNYYDPATKTFHFDYGWGTRHIVGTATRQ